MQRLFGLSMTLNPVVSIVCLIVSGTGMIRPHQIVRSNHTTRFSQSYWWPRSKASQVWKMSFEINFCLDHQHGGFWTVFVIPLACCC
ncbi:hypothetical protein L1887_19079 [Cichorium endivia]|nr:hypothetical protein L1887_19079 [Cichorium endivia]